MSQRVSRRFCDSCDDYVRAEARPVSHLLHLVLSIVTAGFWIIIWVLLVLGPDWHCSQCGDKTQPRPPRGWKANKEPIMAERKGIDAVRHRTSTRDPLASNADSADSDEPNIYEIE